MKYTALYSGFNKKFEGDSLDKMKQLIEDAWGDNFFEYKTAWIMEFDEKNVFIAQYYFSIKDKEWHRQQVKK